MKKFTEIMVTVLTVIIIILMLTMAFLPLFTTLPMTVIYGLAKILLTCIILLSLIIGVLSA